jgi:MSHA biogenesis protein MshJ
VKDAWKRFAHRIDSLGLRERSLVFGGISLLVLAIAYVGVLSPQFAKHKKLTLQLQTDKVQLGTTKADLQKLTKERAVDPDAQEKARLAALREQTRQIRTSMLDTQKDLVAPENMTALVEGILKRNANLRLKSLKTLPVTTLNEAFEEEAKPAERRPTGAPAAPTKAAPPSAEGIYKHGIEIVVEGSYLDILAYLAELETVPDRLFWGRSVLRVEEYPRTTLTLNLFTLSLDKRWMGI